MRAPGRLGAGAISLTVLVLALPVLAEQFLMLALGWSDLYLTRTITDHPTDAKAAVGIGGQLMWLVSVFFATVGTGAMAIVARSIGAGDRAAANRTTRQALLLGFLLGLVSAVLIFAFARPLLWVLQLRGQTLEMAIGYVRTYILGLPVGVLMFMGGACLRGAGDTRSPLLVIGGANVVNIVASWLLRFGGFPTQWPALRQAVATGRVEGLAGWVQVIPPMELRGIAAGTLIAFLFGGTCMLILLYRGRGGLRVRFSRRTRFDWNLIRRIFRIGVFSGLESFLMAGASTAVAAVVNFLGPVSYASYIVAIRLESASFLPGFAFAHAGGALVGQSLGAGRPDRAARCGWWSYLWGGGLMIFMGALFVTVPHWFVNIFVDASANASEARVAEYCIHMVRICGFIQPWLGALLIFAGLLKGAGDTRFPAMFTALGVGLVRLPGAIIVARLIDWQAFSDWMAPYSRPLAGLLADTVDAKIVAIWVVMCADLVVRGTLMAWRFANGGWKKTRV